MKIFWCAFQLQLPAETKTYYTLVTSFEKDNMVEMFPATQAIPEMDLDLESWIYTDKLILLLKIYNEFIMKVIMAIILPYEVFSKTLNSYNTRFDEALNQSMHLQKKLKFTGIFFEDPMFRKYIEFCSHCELTVQLKGRSNCKSYTSHLLYKYSFKDIMPNSLYLRMMIIRQF